MDVYEKINKVVIVCSATQTIRGISHHPRANPASNSSPLIPGKTTDIYCKPGPSAHPNQWRVFALKHPEKGRQFIRLLSTVICQANLDQLRSLSQLLHPTLVKKNTQAAKFVSKMEPEVVKDNPMLGSPEFSIQEGKKLEMHVEDSFTEHINRVKIRMRKTISNVGDMPMQNIFDVSNFNDGENASGKDEISEYIDRAGIKIRTTSSIGGGNSRMFLSERAKDYELHNISIFILKRF